MTEERNANLARKAILGASANWLGALAAFGLRFAANAVLARLVAPAVFGDFAVAFVYTEFVAILAAPSPTQALIQLDSRLKHTIPGVLILNAGIAVCIAAVCLVVRPFAAHAHGQTVGNLVVVLGALRGLGVLAGTYDGYLQNRLRFGHLALVRLIGILVSAFGAIAIAANGYGLRALIAREALAVVVGLAVMLWNMPVEWGLIVRPSPECRHALQRTLSLCRGLFWVRAVEMLHTRVDQLVVATFLGPTELAFYWQARYIAGLPLAGVAPATQTVALRVFVATKGEPARLRRTYELIQLAVGYIVLVAAIFLMYCPYSIVSFAFGAQWVKVADILPYLAPWVVLLALGQNAQTLLMALERWRPLRVALIAQTALQAATLPIMVKWLGASGAALALAVGASVGLLVMNRAVDSHVRLPLHAYKGLIAGCAASLLCVGVLHLSVGRTAETAQEALRLLLVLALIGVVVALVDGRSMQRTCEYLVAQLRRKTE